MPVSVRGSAAATTRTHLRVGSDPLQGYLPCIDIYFDAKQRAGPYHAVSSRARATAHAQTTSRHPTPSSRALVTSTAPPQACVGMSCQQHSAPSFPFSFPFLCRPSQKNKEKNHVSHPSLGHFTSPTPSMSHRGLFSKTHLSLSRRERERERSSV